MATKVKAVSKTLPILTRLPATHQKEIGRIITRYAYLECCMRQILFLAKGRYENHPATGPVPKKFSEFMNTFIFRSTLVGYIQVLNWISNGSPSDVKPETYRNDNVDNTFATYATFFDGLLTKDKKMKTLHKQAAAVFKTLRH